MAHNKLIFQYSVCLSVLCLFSLLACQPNSKKQEPPVDPKAYVQEHLFQANKRGQYAACFLKKKAYCIKDQELLNELIEKHLKGMKQQDRVKPRRAKQLLRRVEMSYRNALHERHYLKLLEKKLIQRFQTPDIKLDSYSIVYDLGILPTKIKYLKRGGYEAKEKIILHQTPAWTSDILGDTFAKLLDKYPDKNQINIHLSVLDKYRSSLRPTLYVYTYKRDRSEFVINLPKKRYRYFIPLPQTGFSDLNAQTTPLVLRDLKPCIRSRGGREDTCGY